MALVVPREGELALLDKMLKETSITDNYILKLYKNNITPDEDSDTSSFTEADFTNYVAITLTRATWNAAQVSATKAESSYGTVPQNWTCGTTGNTIFGYWIESDDGSLDVLWAERFATARVLDNGDVLNITPKFTLASE